MAKTERTCLKCQKPFNSIGVGNRICGKCNEQNLKFNRLPMIRGMSRLNGVPLHQDDGVKSYLENFNGNGFK